METAAPLLRKQGRSTPKNFKVLSLIKAFRNRATFFPPPPNSGKKRSPSQSQHWGFWFRSCGFGLVFQAGQECGLKNATLKEIIQHMKTVLLRIYRFWISSYSRSKQASLDPRKDRISSSRSRFWSKPWKEAKNLGEIERKRKYSNSSSIPNT